MLHKQNIQKQELKLHETIVLGFRLYNPYQQCMDFAPFIQHCYMRITWMRITGLKIFQWWTDNRICFLRQSFFFLMNYEMRNVFLYTPICHILNWAKFINRTNAILHLSHLPLHLNVINVHLLVILLNIYKS